MRANCYAGTRLQRRSEMAPNAFEARLAEMRRIAGQMQRLEQFYAWNTRGAMPGAPGTAMRAHNNDRLARALKNITGADVRFQDEKVELQNRLNGDGFECMSWTIPAEHANLLKQVCTRHVYYQYNDYNEPMNKHSGGCCCKRGYARAIVCVRYTKLILWNAYTLCNKCNGRTPWQACCEHTSNANNSRHIMWNVYDVCYQRDECVPRTDCYMHANTN